MTAARLLATEFDGLRKVIHEVAGITLGDSKQDLVAGRLAPRLRALGLESYGDYLRIVSSDRTGEEARELVNCITTNKTSFFREPHHFDFLKKRLVPEIVERARLGGPKRIRIWSAACSSGQEPWSIAMTLADALGSLAGWDIKILASDLDTVVLEKAEAATYDEVAIAEIPRSLQDRYLEAAPRGESRVVESLRSLVSFRRMNLVAPATWGLKKRFDAVFCRNVAIYFDRETQETLFTGLAGMLEPTGYLMSGHSENLHWLSRVVRPVGNTVHVLSPEFARGLPSMAAAPTLVALPARSPPAAPPPAARTGRVASAMVSALAAPIRRESGVMLSQRPPVDPSKREFAIQVGGVHTSMKGAVIKTVLGSCVAACLFDPHAKVGGMNHFLLPDDRSGSRGPTNFGVHAMETLINSMMKLGGDRSRFVAKVFGGAEQLGSGALTVGRQNAEFVLRFLEEEGIPVVGQKLGGNAALSVVFDTGDGKARVKVLERTIELTQAEKTHVEAITLAKRPIEEDIMFFGTT